MIHAMHALVVHYLDNPFIFHNRMPYYAERVYQKCGLVETVWGFIDGTLCKTCSPSLFQMLMYSGHKQCHGIKFQSVVTPDGLLASMYGLVSENRHESFLLSNSGLLNNLQEFMPDDAPEDIAAVIYSLYGDPAYPQSIHMFGGYKNPADGSAHWNSQKSKVCEVAEWGFANILAKWSFLDFRVAMKSFKILLQNISLLLLSLSIFKPVSMATKLWNTLSVKQCHLMNIYQ
jgi:DDE superfamily endonuclease